MREVKLRPLSAFFVAALLFGSGLLLGIHEIQIHAQEGFSAEAVPPADADFSTLWKTWHLLEEDYVPTHASSAIPTLQERVYGAAQGLVDSYGDPYTVFLPPKQAESFGEEISGAFEGVGMEVGVRDSTLTVVAPLKNSPAEKAGVRSGDKILFIDKTPAENLPVDEAVGLIRGPKGTTVTLTLSRQGVKDPFKISIVRNTIEIPTINYFKRPDGVYVIELYNFSAISVDRFREALRAFVNSRSDKLILDLRGNPGGYLEAAVEMASYFLPIGDTVVTEDFRGKEQNIVHRSKGYNVFASHPIKMAILVDGGSASASEILAGALQQHGVAKLVGAQTFGKGSVQQLIDLGGGAELKVTVARWLTPNGTSISDGGLTPDIKVSISQQDIAAGNDPQREAAVKYLLSN
jgi:carboxyl-terminal processing protease